MAVSDAPASDRPRYDPAVDLEFPPPNLGPSVHVVGTVVNVHPDETPHPKVRRGDMGKVLFDYGRNTMSADIKNVAHYFGADVVGIGRSHPALLYAGGTLRDTGFIVEGAGGPSESP